VTIFFSVKKFCEQSAMRPTDKIIGFGYSSWSLESEKKLGIWCHRASRWLLRGPERRGACSNSSCGPHGLCYVHFPFSCLVAKLEGQLNMAEKCLSKL